MPNAFRSRLVAAALASCAWLALLLFAAAAPAAGADDGSAAWQALRAGGAIALMRHADAPGIGDPPGWRLDDCATQRNLSERGRADALAAGARLRAERIDIGRLVASPWCRCLETARLLGAGEPQVDAVFGNVQVLADQRDRLVRDGRTRLAPWRGPGTLVVVTHGANILALTGMHPASGEIVVVRARNDGTLQTIGRAMPAPLR